MGAGRGRLRLHRAARVVDGAGVDASPGVLLRDDAEVIAAGPPERIGVPADAEIQEHPDHVLLPALGNAHAHLDLSSMEPEPFDGDFPQWLDRVRRFRAGSDEAGARKSLLLGAELSFRGGVALVGDILGAPLRQRGAEVLGRSGLRGVAFVELFGAGSSEPAALATIDAVIAMAAGERADKALQLGLQPHAPYSTTAKVMAAALESSLPVSMHVAESHDEVEFCRSGSGAIRRLLEEVGVVSREAPLRGIGGHPVRWFCDRLAGRVDAVPRLAVHLEEMPIEYAPALAASGAVAVFCPRASAFFGRGGMPWRALRSAGVPVALGTDGRLVLDTPDRISTLDEMRLLARRDGASLVELLPMATTAVARALGSDERPYTLAPGPKPGVLMVEGGGDRAEGVLSGHAPPSWLFGPARRNAHEADRA